jgi:hypothetical protein
VITANRITLPRKKMITTVTITTTASPAEVVFGDEPEPSGQDRRRPGQSHHP